MTDLLGTIEAIALARSSRAVTAITMDALPVIFGARAVAMGHYDGGNPVDIEYSGMSSSVLAHYERCVHQVDEVQRRVFLERRCIDNLMVTSEEGWNRHPMYQEIGRPSRVRHYLCAPIVRSGRVIGMFSAARPEHSAPFGTEMRERALVLAMHLSEALTRLQYSVSFGDPDALTDRELQIARAISAGLKNKEVAAELGISVDAVKDSLRRSYRKLGVRSRLELVAALGRA